jgi:hypothetical protein
VHPADDALEVEDDVGDVLLDARDRRELVRDALDPTLVTAAPASEESSTRRSELPNV